MEKLLKHPASATQTKNRLISNTENSRLTSTMIVTISCFIDLKVLSKSQFKIPSKEHTWKATNSCGVDEGVPQLIGQVVGEVRQKRLWTTDSITSIYSV